ncbi:hypothetical protein K474DRAFT_1561847, partial [Panus rudis PR-1116 ss-1]
RTIALGASFAGVIFNFVFTVRLLALWRSLRWESESEWESSADAWRVDPVKLVWGLLSAYFALAAAASAVGFVGIARSIPTFVRVFRDYSIADFAFVTVSTITISYTAFTSPWIRTSVCEELSRQPDLLRQISETGLSLENCEFLFERALIVILGASFILIAIRLHFVLAISRFYNVLRRERGTRLPHTAMRPVKSDSLQRIYLLPTPTSPSTPCSYNFNSSLHSHSRSKSMTDVVVYAPVPVGGISEQEAREMHATEAWISTSSTPLSRPSSSPRSHRHAHSHSHIHSHGGHSHR